MLKPASGVYQETNRYNAEIIAYYNSSNNLVHTGVVVSAMEGTENGVCGDSNLVMVESKWGYYGLYLHRGDQCPYTSSHQGDSTYVKYYSYCGNNHVHTFSYSSQNNSCYLKICSSGLCSINLLESHNILYNTYNANYHTKHCTECSFSIQETHEWERINDILFLCSKCGQRARYIPIIHRGIENQLLNAGNINCSCIIYYEGQYYLLELVEDQ